MSPGVRIESGHLKNRLPAIRLGRHFPQAGNRAFSQVVRLFSVAVHRLPFRKALTSENCGFVLCTKCGPCRTARKQFSKGLRSKTGVQQHPKNTQKDIFDKLNPRRKFPARVFVAQKAISLILSPHSGSVNRYRPRFRVPFPYWIAPVGQRLMQAVHW